MFAVFIPVRCYTCDLQTVKGERVTKVAVGSPAAQSGLMEGMRIVGVNGVPMGTNTKEIVAAVRQAWSYDSMQLHIKSSGSTAPPPLEGSISDVCSQASGRASELGSQCGSQHTGSAPYTPKSMTHSPYAFEPENINLCQSSIAESCPPLLNTKSESSIHDGGSQLGGSGRLTYDAVEGEARTITVVKMSPSFGAVCNAGNEHIGG